MQGYNVFFPIGFDAFGLPAENAAIKHGVHPAKWTDANIERMRQQLRLMGAMWAWDREAVSCNPEYYKWSQWFFRKFYDAGIAYREFAPVDFCPTCNTTLAREQVWGDDRHCERCGTPVIKKELEQWKFRITAYADDLLDGLEQIDWPERVKVMQTNWIGRSFGAQVVFHTEQGEPLEIFTTRPDTLWGATFMVLAPEHPLVDSVTTDAARAAVAEYVVHAARMDEIQRGAADKEKTGVFTGGYATNPVNGERIPIWIADYVMMGYGTGAIMAVPAHDERDFAFATKFGLEIRRVITGPDGATGPLAEAYDAKEQGEMINSGAFDGTPVKGAVAKVTEWLEANSLGKGAVNYRLRDWLISRQRMWGTPIPIIYCPDCGTVPVPYADLPVLLPDDAEFKPTGESPLKYHEGFRYVKCPECAGGRRTGNGHHGHLHVLQLVSVRLRLTLLEDRRAADRRRHALGQGQGQLLAAGGPVHRRHRACHYAPVVHAFLHQGAARPGRGRLRRAHAAPVQPGDDPGPGRREDVQEPGQRHQPRRICGEIWRRHGARLPDVHRPVGYGWTVGYECNRRRASLPAPRLGGGDRRPAIGQPNAGSWRPGRPQGSAGAGTQTAPDDLEGDRRHARFRFNTAIASLMELNNALYKVKESPVVNTALWNQAIRDLLLMMAPIFPHAAEELWHRQGNTSSVHKQRWPEGDPEKARAEEITVVVQINGRIRDKLVVAPGTPGSELERQALALDAVARWGGGKAIQRVIVVPDKLVNIVVG